MTRLNNYAVAANSNIFLGDDIRAAEMPAGPRDTDIAPVEPTVLKLSLWVVPCSRRSCVVLLLPIETDPPDPIRPLF